MDEINMNAKSSPVEEHQLLTSWLAVIGMLTMYWSPVERHIDQCVHFLHGLQAQSKKTTKPTRLGSKLDFIKRNLPIGIIDVQELEILMMLTKDTVRIRDVCVHGVLNSYDQQKIEIGKVDGREGKYLIENFTIDRNRLDRSAQALSALQMQWDSIASALLERAHNA
ncbi:MAG: hypothetical protein ABI040_10370 [Rhodoferax sp.]